jgi:hypothetical protein
MQVRICGFGSKKAARGFTPIFSRQATTPVWPSISITPGNSLISETISLSFSSDSITYGVREAAFL